MENIKFSASVSIPTVDFGMFAKTKVNRTTGDIVFYDPESDKKLIAFSDFKDGKYNKIEFDGTAENIKGEKALGLIKQHAPQLYKDIEKYIDLETLKAREGVATVTPAKTESQPQTVPSSSPKADQKGNNFPSFNMDGLYAVEQVLGMNDQLSGRTPANNSVMQDVSEREKTFFKNMNNPELLQMIKLNPELGSLAKEAIVKMYEGKEDQRDSTAVTDAEQKLESEFKKKTGKTLDL